MGFLKVVEHVTDDLFYVMYVMVFARFRRRHGNRKSLPVCQVECVGRLPFLPTLVSDFFTATECSRVAPVQIHAGHVQLMAVFVKQPDPHGFPLARLAPFVVMVIHGTIAQYLAAKQGFHRKERPLTTGLQLVQDGVYHLYETTLSDITTFCLGKMRQYFIFIVSLSSTVYIGLSLYMSLVTHNIRNNSICTLCFNILIRF